MSNLRQPQNFLTPYDVTSLITHLGSALCTPAACFYAVSEIDGTVVAMTSYSSDLTGVPGYPGVTFKRNTGVSSSQLQGEAGNAFSQMEASLFLLAAGITEADVLAGKWAHASAVLFVCNYEQLNMGQLIMESGYLAEFVQKSPIVTAEIKGLNNALTAQIGTVTRPECSHDFCDAGCALLAANYTVTGTLTGVTSQTVFAVSALTAPNEYFNNGKFVFTSGTNANYILRIDSYNSATKTFTLRTPAPYLPIVGQTFSALAGCQKRLVDCQTRLQNNFVTIVNNVVNRKAFDFVPTLESFSRLPAGVTV
jgi:uncharacterized phage protein (TIGR02218 family)